MQRHMHTCISVTKQKQREAGVPFYKIVPKMIFIYRRVGLTNDLCAVYFFLFYRYKTCTVQITKILNFVSNQI